MDLPYIAPAAAPLVDDPYTAWRRHIDAGRIATTPMPPEVRAQAEANDALFRGLARDTRILAAHHGEVDRYCRRLVAQAAA